MYRYMLLSLLLVSVANAEGIYGPTANCSMNEYWSMCGRNCDETCNIPYPLCRYVMFFPTCRSEPGCTCTSNYIRLDNGTCVGRSICDT